MYTFSLSASFFFFFFFLQNRVIYSQWSYSKTETLYLCDNDRLNFLIQSQIIHFRIGQNGSLFMISLVLYRFCSFLSTFTIDYLRIRRYDAIFFSLCSDYHPSCCQIHLCSTDMLLVCEKSSLTPGQCPLHFFLTCQSLSWKIRVNIPHIVILLTYSIYLFLHTQNILV